ncbi:hypothetical protein [Janthinobacterium sp. ROICE36]|uniref:hypothetical protein n=1 Tax=Janthinobacterium sp. ROICE36 TaxID=2048670 RepID=UPI0011AF028D|nr:hypothetical protein [Janthinobacterium sp. ROICE36]
MTDAISIDKSLLPAALLEVAARARKTDADKELLAPYKEMSLSAGAKTYLGKLAKQFVYSYNKVVETKYMDKGLACEDEAIDMINRLRFESYTKNTERREDEFLTGECDIYVPGVKTIDTKVSWDLDTFPALSEDCHDSLYEWQGRAYMRLWDVPEHEVCFVMLNTPDELIRYEQRELHEVEHIDPALRLTSITYQRDAALEEKMVNKCRVAQKYLLNTVARINLEHKSN